MSQFWLTLHFVLLFIVLLVAIEIYEQAKKAQRRTRNEDE